jgi:hypothetical protein
MGHATIAIILDTYSNVLPGVGNQTATAMDNALPVIPANRRKSGEGGIRTHETVQHRLRDFQSRSFGQLGHLSGDTAR